MHQAISVRIVNCPSNSCNLDCYTGNFLTLMTSVWRYQQNIMKKLQIKSLSLCMKGRRKTFKNKTSIHFMPYITS